MEMHNENQKNNTSKPLTRDVIGLTLALPTLAEAGRGHRHHGHGHHHGHSHHHHHNHSHQHHLGGYNIIYNQPRGYYNQPYYPQPRYNYYPPAPVYGYPLM